jgi:hypothetical protein
VQLPHIFSQIVFGSCPARPAPQGSHLIIVGPQVPRWPIEIASVRHYGAEYALAVSPHTRNDLFVDAVLAKPVAHCGGHFEAVPTITQLQTRAEIHSNQQQFY